MVKASLLRWIQSKLKLSKTELKAGTEQSRLPEDDLQFLKNFLQLMNLQMATSVLGINRE